MALSCDGQAWSQDELFHLESSLILATEEPLCLEPSPAAMMVDNALQYERNFLNDPNLKRFFLFFIISFHILLINLN